LSRSVCVVTEGGEEGVSVIRHEYTPLGASFKNEGATKPNTLSAHFTISNRVREGDEIVYIQDIISVEYLACIHNFQLSALDDRGYNVDGVLSSSVNIPESRFDNVTSGRFKGNYALNFTTSSEDEKEQVNIPNATAITRIDLSGQFDIYVFFTPDQLDPSLTGSNPILWSFYDSDNGVEIGMTNSTPVANTRVYVRAFSKPGTDTITGTTEPIITGAPVLIRVYRGGDNIVHTEVNGIEDGTAVTVTGSMQPTDANVYFGNGRNQNDAYKGLIHQVRVYRGTVLTQAQADAIRQSRPALFTMKFAGLVWDLQDRESYKIARCDSYSKQLVKKILRVNDFGNKINTFGLQEELGTIYSADVVLAGTGYADGQIVGLTGVVSLASNATATVSSTGGVIESIAIIDRGSGYNNGETLTIVGNISSNATAIAVALDETFKDILQAIVTAGVTDFTVKAKDAFTSTTSTTASAILNGNLIARGSFLGVISMLFLFSSTTFYVTPRKLLIVETNAGHATDYTFDQDSDTNPYNITESDNNATTKITEVTFTGDDIPTATAPTSVTGTQVTLRKFIRQLNDTIDIDALARIIVDILSIINTQYVVKINVVVNWIRFNHIVTINNTKKKITNVPFIITQMSHDYPRSDTTIMVNENDIDFFEITDRDISIQESLTDNMET